MRGEFVFVPTAIADLMIVERQPKGDERGFLCRLFCAKEFSGTSFNQPIAQINHTLTRRRGSLRGLHFQFSPHAEDKLVSCLKGEIFDVAVDLRQGSSTFLHWHGEILSERNSRGLLIPRGFAHGFQTLANDCELIYLHSSPYVPEAEGGLNAADPALAIDWPLAVTDMSVRDRTHSLLTSEFRGVTP